jgi:hypothetical protein
MRRIGRTSATVIPRERAAESGEIRQRKATERGETL